MALPGPGNPISFSQINTELGFASTATCSLQTRTGQTVPNINQSAPYSVSEFQNHAQSVGELDPASRTVAGANGTTAQFTITSNTSWTLSDNSGGWASPSVSSGSGNSSVTYTLTENPGPSTRFATVSITVSGQVTDTATIAQQPV